MTNKYFLSIGIGILLISVGVLYYFNAPNRVSYLTVYPKVGQITQKVLATGNVEPPTVNSLRFGGVGKLVSLNVKTGDNVKRGDVLARQDTSVLNATLIQARANVRAANATLQKLKAGATTQTVALAKTKLSTAKRSLQNSYSSVKNTLIDAQTKAIDAVTNQLADFFLDPQTSNPRLTFIISDYSLLNKLTSERANATNRLSLLQKEVSDINASSTPSKYNSTLSRVSEHLLKLHSLLKDSVAAVAVNTGLPPATEASYRAVSSAGLNEINAASTEIQNLQHLILIKTAAVASAQAALNLTTAPPTKNTVNEQEARVSSFNAVVNNILAQIKNLEIIAPVSGIITNTNGTVGDILNPSITVVSLMPYTKLQVNANVSEDNIVGVSVGDTTSIKLDAFPLGITFFGTVSEIDPAQTVVRGAVYYKTTIIFDKDYKNIKSGMTANVQITTASSTNALLVPASAVTTTATSSSVRILTNNKPITHEVKIAIVGQNGMIQVVDGISTKDKVIIGEK